MLNLFKKLLPARITTGQQVQRFDPVWRERIQHRPTKVHVCDSGDAIYKYFRALNGERIGAVQARVDCGRIRGRSGLLWDRHF